MDTDYTDITNEQIVKDLTTSTIKEIEEPVKKKHNTSFSLSLSNTFQRSRITCPSLKDPMENGGWSCSKCGEIVSHDDCLGTPESHGFRVIGYFCQKCHHRWLRTKYADIEQRSGQSYMTMSKWEIKRPVHDDSSNNDNVNIY